ncbi:hypothetical protein CW745_10065 [Psychromonas sp. psych-6C06]|nr:hypothetical protein CW745_10065 [Psychromonas sp. psych-6C06]
MVFMLSFFVFLVAVFAMALGHIFAKKKLQGSCGGLANIGIEESCQCTGKICSSRLYQIKEPQG